MVILSTVLLISKNEKLCMEGKRTKKSTYIARGCFIRSRRGLSCTSCPGGAAEWAAEAAAE